MAISISNFPPVNAVVHSKDTPERKPAAAASTDAPAATTTVTISSAASQAAQAAQEASESPAQTANEAQANDSQAKRLLAKQAAAVKLYQS